MPETRDLDRKARAFDLLHPCIQEQLYRMQWTQLRPIQVAAIQNLLQGEAHLLVAANTAAGKTEAAFLPILSRLAEERSHGVAALYVSPLKALINDQFRRLEELCAGVDIEVHHWHGDVAAADKRALLRSPNGVILITPESIESLFINHPHRIDPLFDNLRFVVLDELHAFIGQERGAHLRSLLHRVIVRSRSPVRRVGLSATLGDLPAAAAWMCGSETVTIVTGDIEKSIKISLRGFLRTTEDGDATASLKPDHVPVLDAGMAVEEPPITPADLHLAEALWRAFSRTNALIFANSRAKLEFYADLVRQLSEKQGQRNPFCVHHASLSKAEREATEEGLRSDRPTPTFCSSTLELGIDVGKLAEIGQIGSPWSVSSLAQRLGRSGRREGDASVLRMYIEEDQPSADSSVVDRLFPQLLQALAMTELMLAGWCEPPDGSHLHLSTLVQQVLSVIAERGGARADALYSTLIAEDSFSNVSRATFMAVLRSMGGADLIEQTTEGDLILGLKGERIVRSRDFYAAFATEQELQVVHNGRCIGTIAASPGAGGQGFIILAGRRWKIVKVDEAGKVLIVEPSAGGRVPYFAGCGGADIDARVRREMRSIVTGNNSPAYLDRTLRSMLADARSTARAAALNQLDLILEGVDTVWFTWTGSKTNRTLAALGSFAGGLEIVDKGIALNIARRTPDQVREVFQRLLNQTPSSLDLASTFAFKGGAKYDAFLSETLLSQAFAWHSLDLAGAQDLIRRACSVNAEVRFPRSPE